MSKKKPTKLIISCSQSPGDQLLCSIPLFSLHDLYKGEYLTDIRCSCPSIYDNNPYITPLDEKDSLICHMEYNRPDVDYARLDNSNERPIHFGEAYTAHLADFLGRPLTARTNRPQIYLSEKEMSYMSRPQELTGRPIRHWLTCFGKKDYPIKSPVYDYIQEVVDHFWGKITFIQVGEDNSDHLNPPLKHVINQIGKTTTRELIRLVATSDGVVSGITFIYWIACALKKPAVLLLGGREPVSWVYCPGATILHNIGLLPCNKYGACWRNVCTKDTPDRPDWQICELPIYGRDKVYPQCLAMITPDMIIKAIEAYL